MKDLNNVIEKIKKDEKLKKEFATAVKEKKVVDFLKGLGVSVTKEELDSFLKAKKAELKDAELEKAVGAGCGSGGCGGTDVFVTIVMLGGGCYAGLTIVNRAIEGRSSCITVPDGGL